MIDALEIRVHGSLAAAARDLETPGLAGYAFGRLAWLQAWQAAFGHRDAMRIAIATVADTRVRMVLPLGVARQGGLRVLTFLGAPVTDYNAPLVEPALAAALDAGAVRAVWARIRAAMPRHDIVRLLAMPASLDPAEGAGGTPVPNPLVRLSGVESAGQGLSRRLPADDAALTAALRPSAVKKMRAGHRRLGKQGPVALTVMTSETEREALTTALKAMKSRRWRETGDRDWFADPALVAFYETMSRLELPEGRVHATMLTVGETPVATHLGLAYRDRLYFLMVGWQGGTWAAYSPGRLMVDALMRLCISEGLKVFDFTAGDEPYKREWADTELPLLRCEAATSLRGAVFLRATRTLGHLRAGAKRIQWLRGVVRRLAGRRPLQSTGDGG